MRRTVKAWSILWDGGILLPAYTRTTKDSAIHAAHQVADCAVSTKGWGVYPRVVPVTMTFDDGRPAPRKRTKGGRRG